jgi:hypothetical protein
MVTSGALDARDAEAILLNAVTRRVSFVQSLVERGPAFAQLLEPELSKLPVPVLDRVRADRVLCERLPPGLCEQLLAVPVGRDAEGDLVQLAAVDPLDDHVAQELGFHLRARVTVRRATFAQVVAAIDALLASRDQPAKPRASGAGPPTPAFGTRLNERAAQSVPAIPLVRRQAGDGPSPDAFEMRRRQGLDDSRRRLRAAATASDLTRILLDVMRREAASVAVCAVRDGQFEALAADHRGPVAAERLRRVRAPITDPSALASAVLAGYYLGPFKGSSLDSELSAVLGTERGEEIYAVAVWVSGRVVLGVVLSGFDNALETTARVDELANVAAARLEALLRERKRKR